MIIFTKQLTMLQNAMEAGFVVMLWDMCNSKAS